MSRLSPIKDAAADEVAVSGIGTVAAARVRPGDVEPFIVVSMYARWMMPHPTVPICHLPRRNPETASVQLDYVFVSRGFHESVEVRALNSAEAWGASDHCRLLIEVSG